MLIYAGSYPPAYRITSCHRDTDSSYFPSLYSRMAEKMVRPKAEGVNMVTVSPMVSRT